MSLRVAVVLFTCALLLGCPKKDACNNECAEGRTCCDGECVNLNNDKLNCGACGTSCSDIPNVSPQCSAGRCQLNCVSGFGNCDGVRENGCEYSTLSDINNCGICNQVCTAANAQPLCSNAQCALGTCDEGYGDCNIDQLDGCEVDTRITRAHCGACGHRCVLAHADAGCGDSLCRVTACSPGWANCNADAGQPGNDDGCEINTVTGTPLPNDAGVTNCGACGYTCGPGQYCRDSLCRADELIYYGGLVTTGTSGGSATAETWKFDLKTSKFRQLTPTGADTPGARQVHVAVWDLPRNRMLVFGGAEGNGQLWTQNGLIDGWQLSFATATPAWSRVAMTGDVPSQRRSAAAAVDPTTWKLYYFGGEADDSVPCSSIFCAVPYSDLYELDLATLKWTKLHDSHDLSSDPCTDYPCNRVSAAAAFDPQRRVFVLYGGASASTDPMYDGRDDLNEVWRFDVQAGTWALTMPDMATVPARNLGALFSGSPVALFSGVQKALKGQTCQPSGPVMGCYNMRQDLLTFDTASAEWTALPPWTEFTTGPQGRFGAGAVARDGLLYVFGGKNQQGTGAGSASYPADTWVYTPDAGSWRLLNDGGVSAGTRPDGGSGLPGGQIYGSMVAR